MLVTRKELVAGALLDLVFGDPRWLPHPVRAVGWLARVTERALRKTCLPLRLAGLVFWVAVVGISTLAVWLSIRSGPAWVRVYWIYSLLACRDLDVEARHVIQALNPQNQDEARKRLSWIVGRDTAALDEREIVRAVVETVAENLSDGVVAPLFYLTIAGPLGMAAYKAANTLDSTVGHRNERYREFGWASARIDDVANFIPARLTAMLVWISALLPGFSARRALKVTLRDGGSQPSPNSGYPEAAFAGALGVQLGGLNFYGGRPSVKPAMGDAAAALDRLAFSRARVLLYAATGLCVAAILRCLPWR